MGPRHAPAPGPTKPAGFCQFYKIIKMIIKSIKVFVEWKFIPGSSGLAGFGGLLIGARVTGERPETAPQWGDQRTTERSIQERDKAGFWYQRVNHSDLISDFWITLESTAKRRTAQAQLQRPVFGESWIGKLCFDNLIDGKTYLQHNLGSIKNKSRIKILCCTWNLC